VCGSAGWCVVEWGSPCGSVGPSGMSNSHRVCGPSQPCGGARGTKIIGQVTAQVPEQARAGNGQWSGHRVAW